jgi:hypothetical protein
LRSSAPRVCDKCGLKVSDVDAFNLKDYGWSDFQCLVRHSAADRMAVVCYGKMAELQAIPMTLVGLTYTESTSGRWDGSSGTSTRVPPPVLYRRQGLMQRLWPILLDRMLLGFSVLHL